MSATVLSMSMSLDGFIAGPHDDPQNGLGINGHRLHDWLSDGSDPGSSRLPRSPTSATASAAEHEKTSRV